MRYVGKSLSLTYYGALLVYLRVVELLSVLLLLLLLLLLLEKLAGCC